VAKPLLPEVGETVRSTVLGEVVSRDLMSGTIRIRTADPEGGYLYSTLWPATLHDVERVV
jgi:hypothetical protein